MNASYRATLLVILLLAMLRVPAIASCQVVIEHNWSVIGPGGHYGVFQYRTGPGPFDADTALLFGPRNADIPLPLYAIMFACAVPVLALLALFCRGICAEASFSKKIQRTAATLGSRPVRIICPRLLQPTGRFRRRSLSLVYPLAE
jgi:hypothetical protein